MNLNERKKKNDNDDKKSKKKYELLLNVVLFDPSCPWIVESGS